MKLDRYGYARCDRCGTLRPATGLVTLTMHAQGTSVVRVECSDVEFCAQAAKRYMELQREAYPAHAGSPEVVP